MLLNFLAAALRATMVYSLPQLPVDSMATRQDAEILATRWETVKHGLIHLQTERSGVGYKYKLVAHHGNPSPVPYISGFSQQI